MKYELYVGLSDKDLNLISREDAISFLLEQSALMNLDITIISSTGLYNKQKETGLIITHIAKSIGSITIGTNGVTGPENKAMKLLGEMYKNKFNQDKVMLTFDLTTYNVY